MSGLASSQFLAAFCLSKKKMEEYQGVTHYLSQEIINKGVMI